MQWSLIETLMVSTCPFLTTDKAKPISFSMSLQSCPIRLYWGFVLLGFLWFEGWFHLV